VAPEKVKEVPLEVSLAEGYRYTLEGTEDQRGVSCYRIAFEPGEGQDAAFRGRVWIDRERFLRVRMDLVRLRPSPPVTSDVLTQWFEPVDTEEGTFVLMTRADGQMIFSALGRNAILEREVRFRDFRVNRPTFDEERRAALASADPMYRDSLEGGLETLVPDGDGQRTSRSATTKSNTLVAGGWGGSLDGDVGTPFVGANWFDLDFRGSGTQLDLAWAGPFVGLSVTWPEILRSRWESTLESRTLLLARREKFTDAEEGRRSSQDLEQLDETVVLSFRRTLSPAVTLGLEPGITWSDWDFREGRTDPDYVLPTTTFIPSLGLRLDVDRKGYLFAFSVQGEHRLDWGPFGPAPVPDPDDPGKLIEAESLLNVRDTAVRYRMQFTKNVSFRGLDRFSASLDLMDGQDLDRFSSFRLRGFQNVNIKGYNSTGLRFHRGATSELEYAFRLGRVRVDTSVGGGYFENIEDLGDRWHWAYGAGVGVTFSGPAGTLFRVRTIYGIDSSLPLEGSQGSVRLTVFKTFHGWWPRGRKRGEAAATAPDAVDDADALEEAAEG
jgi:hypothetical protein